MLGTDVVRNAILSGVIGNTAFVLVVAILVYAFRLRDHLRLLHFLGASRANPTVEIVLSNLYADGNKHTPEATEVTTRGYIGSAVAQHEYEAAVRLRDSLCNSFIPFLPTGVLGPAALLRPTVNIRPSRPQTGAEMAAGFRGQGGTPAAVVVIGSPVYNRAAFDLIDGTLDEEEGYPNPPRPALTTSSPQLIYLRQRALVSWVRYQAADPKSEKTRQFAWANRAAEPDGKRTRGRPNYEQSVVQRLSFGAETAGVPGLESLAGTTITLMAGLGDRASELAVAEFLSGQCSWRAIRRQALRSVAKGSSWDAALMFSTPHGLAERGQLGSGRAAEDARVKFFPVADKEPS